MSTWLFIDCFLLILIIWWIYDLLKGNFIIDKLGAKASFNWLIGVVIFTIVVVFFTFPLAKTAYEIRQYIRSSELNQYISSYKLEGFRDSIVIAKGNKKFKELDNKTKFEYMNEIEDRVASIVSSNYGIGDGGYIRIHKMRSDMKVEVCVNGDKYAIKRNTLILNGKEIYNEKETV
ncbi:hypothetical protein GNF80_03160 [Clostridium perfringens]|nr:hypothetical protein [Clostridium perfringens]